GLVDHHLLIFVRDFGQIGMNRQLAIVFFGAQPDADVTYTLVFGIDKPLVAHDRAAVLGHALRFFARVELLWLWDGVAGPDDASFDRATFLVPVSSGPCDGRTFRR